jgi:hypothetical protein
MAPAAMLAVARTQAREARTALRGQGEDENTTDSQGRVGHRWRRAVATAFSAVRWTLATRAAQHMRRFHRDPPANVAATLASDLGVVQCEACRGFYRDVHALAVHQRPPHGQGCGTGPATRRGLGVPRGGHVTRALSEARGTPRRADRGRRSAPPGP